jgi:hypothetical protein
MESFGSESVLSTGPRGPSATIAVEKAMVNMIPDRTMASKFFLFMAIPLQMIFLRYKV